MEVLSVYSPPVTIQLTFSVRQSDRDQGTLLLRTRKSGMDGWVVGWMGGWMMGGWVGG